MKMFDLGVIEECTLAQRFLCPTLLDHVSFIHPIQTPASELGVNLET